MNIPTRHLMNLIYGIPRYRKQLQALHPDMTILAMGATKGRRMEAEAALAGVDWRWAFARRAVLVLTEDRLFCRDWVMPIDQIQKAEMLSSRSTFGTKSQIFMITMKDGTHYQFGLEYDPAWEEQSVLAFEPGEMTARSRVVVRLVRGIFYAYLLWTAYRIFFL